MDSLWQQSSEWLELYGASQLLLVATLSAITIFRREMSCNHCYYQESDDEASSKGSSSLSEDWDDGETEELLEGAGRYCSVACLAPVLEKLKETSEEALLLAATTTAQDPQVSAEELLEGAGCFCSGFPYTAKLLHPRMALNATLLNQPAKPFVTNLPLDAQVHVFMFLHPKDLLNVACVNRKCRDLLDQDTSTTTLTNSCSSSQTIWKRLWQRDYEWLLQAWPVGQRALHRSLNNSNNHNHTSTTTSPSSLLAQVHFTKDFYFYFSLAFTNYLLAGNNTHECCLVGVGGHIYDLTFFLSSHPGSPETVMAHAGKEATAFFDGMNHSFGARRIARSLCVVVDTAFLSREVCGTCPTNVTTTTTNTTSNNHHNHSSIPPCVEAPVTFNSQTVIRKKGSLQRIRDAFLQQQASYQILVENMKIPELLGDINLYYDPMVQKWKAWYTAHNLTTVFVDTLNEDVLY